jgi:YVTN family beta-propeller protein
MQPKYSILLLTIILLAISWGCMNDDEWIDQNKDRYPGYRIADNGVFIVNEGNFMYGNASLSFYNPDSNKIENNIFSIINPIPLGDVALSMTINDDLGYIVINNSGKINTIDINTGEYKGKITGLVSPRYIHFINSEKAYVTDLYSGIISIVNPQTFEITGEINTGQHLSTEQMVQFENKVYTTCWSFDSTLIVIDSETDKIINEIPVGRQPNGIVLDKNNKLWVLCDGGWGQTTSNIQHSLLVKIDAASGNRELSLKFKKDAIPYDLSINGTRDTIYFINEDVWKMPVSSEQMPDTPFFPSKGTIYYGLGIHPTSSDVYISDAIDYMQQGVVYRLSPQGLPTDSIKAGIIPGAFCFK